MGLDLPRLCPGVPVIVLWTFWGMLNIGLLCGPLSAFATHLLFEPEEVTVWLHVVHSGLLLDQFAISRVWHVVHSCLWTCQNWMSSWPICAQARLLCCGLCFYRGQTFVLNMTTVQGLVLTIAVWKLCEKNHCNWIQYLRRVITQLWTRVQYLGVCWWCDLNTYHEKRIALTSLLLGIDLSSHPAHGKKLRVWSYGIACWGLRLTCGQLTCVPFYALPHDVVHKLLWMMAGPETVSTTVRVADTITLVLSKYAFVGYVLPVCQLVVVIDVILMT